MVKKFSVQCGFIVIAILTFCSCQKELCEPQDPVSADSLVPVQWFIRDIFYTQTNAAGVVDSTTLTYIYDSAKHLITVKNLFGNLKFLRTYQYNADNNLTELNVYYVPTGYFLRFAFARGADGRMNSYTWSCTQKAISGTRSHTGNVSYQDIGEETEVTCADTASAYTSAGTRFTTGEYYKVKYNHKTQVSSVIYPAHLATHFAYYQNPDTLLFDYSPSGNLERTVSLYTDHTMSPFSVSKDTSFYSYQTNASTALSEFNRFLAGDLFWMRWDKHFLLYYEMDFEKTTRQPVTQLMTKHYLNNGQVSSSVGHTQVTNVIDRTGKLLSYTYTFPPGGELQSQSVYITYQDHR